MLCRSHRGRPPWRPLATGDQYSRVGGARAALQNAIVWQHCAKCDVPAERMGPDRTIARRMRTFVLLWQYKVEHEGVPRAEDKRLADQAGCCKWPMVSRSAPVRAPSLSRRPLVLGRCAGVALSANPHHPISHRARGYDAQRQAAHHGAGRPGPPGLSLEFGHVGTLRPALFGGAANPGCRRLSGGVR